LNLAFDPVAAAQTYAGMDTEELVRIAYLEPDYVAEAKALALRELDKRGVPADPKKLIRQVRDEIRDNAGAAHRLTAANIEQARKLEFRFVVGLLIFVLWLAALRADSHQRGAQLPGRRCLSPPAGWLGDRRRRRGPEGTARKASSTLLGRGDPRPLVCGGRRHSDGQIAMPLDEAGWL
jgi:hypothetical protein